MIRLILSLVVYLGASGCAGWLASSALVTLASRAATIESAPEPGNEPAARRTRPYGCKDCYPTVTEPEPDTTRGD